MAVAKSTRISSIAPVSNGAEPFINLSAPYLAQVTLQGTADLLFHRWNCEAVNEKAALAKGSKGKKTDNVESFVYRNEAGEICIPGEYLRMAIVNASKFRQDPRSPRKSAMDLFKAGIVTLTSLASLGKADWDYLHQSRVMIQRSGVNRLRPAILKGWQADFDIQVLLPEYIDQSMLHSVISDAGRLIGLADFRPTYGRFQIMKFETS